MKSNKRNLAKLSQEMTKSIIKLILTLTSLINEHVRLFIFQKFVSLCSLIGDLFVYQICLFTCAFINFFGKTYKISSFPNSQVSNFANFPIPQILQLYLLISFNLAIHPKTTLFAYFGLFVYFILENV